MFDAFVCGVGRVEELEFRVISSKHLPAIVPANVVPDFGFALHDDTPFEILCYCRQICVCACVCVCVCV